jgi:type IV secretory pathway TrbL component
MADASTQTRQRLDFVDKPDGSVDAVLTISLPGGVQKRFTTNVHPSEAQAISGEIIGAEVLLRPQVGFSFKGVFKSVGKLAKKVASSKVFALAASGLALAAPLLGPIAPAALGAAAGLGVAAKLAKAGVAAAHGAKAVADELTAAAASDAKRLTTTPAGAAALLAAANKKRLGAEKIANSARENVAPKSAPARPSNAAPARCASATQFPPMSEGDLLARARAGRVRSNDGAAVSTSQLLAAHQQGRIFWVH